MTKVSKEHVEIGNLSEQLRCPEGESGKQVGNLMYDSNKGMIESSVKALRLSNNNRILEIGPGNSAHVSKLLEREKGLRYFGLDVSDTMIKEVIANNAQAVQQRKALFHHYNGQKIDYVQHWFDRILTVNTIYFWKRPVAFLNELYRVLKPGGRCVITFVDGDFMKDLPFVDKSFRLYTLEDFKDLIPQTRFEFSYFRMQKESVKSKSGELVNRPFIIAILLKEAINPEYSLNISET